MRREKGRKEKKEREREREKKKSFRVFKTRINIFLGFSKKVFVLMYFDRNFDIKRIGY